MGDESFNKASHSGVAKSIAPSSALISDHRISPHQSLRSLSIHVHNNTISHQEHHTESDTRH